MIKSFAVVNHLGESLYMDIRRPEETGFLINSVTGLTPPKAEIASEPYAAYDGSVVGNTRIESRNIVISIMFYENNDEKLTIEELRHKCYRYFPLKKVVTFYAENDSGIYWTSGYVESNEPNVFSQKESAQISIVCPDPYFIKGTSENIAYISSIVPVFHFPFSSEMELPLGDYKLTPNYFGGYDFFAKVEYEIVPENGRYIVAGLPVYESTENEDEGFTFSSLTNWHKSRYLGGYLVEARPDGHTEFVCDSYLVRALYSNDSIEFGKIKSYPSTLIDYEGSGETGVTIRINALGPVTGFRINNVTRDEHIIINDNKIPGNGIQKNDEIVIVTERSRKSALLYRDGIWYNIIGACSTAANWIYLQSGPNNFTCSTTSNIYDVKVYVNYFTKVEGV